MDIVQLVVVGMVLTILATITLAAVSYGAFKVRDRKSSTTLTTSEASGPMLLERVHFVPSDKPLRE